MVDGPEHVSAVICLVKHVILAALNRLDRDDLLKPGSKIMNIALTSSFYLAVAAALEGYGFEEDLKTWPAQIIAYLKHAGIELSDKTGVVGTDKNVKAYERKAIAYAKFKKAGEDRWGFKAALNKFHKDYYGHIDQEVKRIGGIKYDITKMSRRERKKGNYRGVDPIDEMGMPPDEG